MFSVLWSSIIALLRRADGRMVIDVSYVINVVRFTDGIKWVIVSPEAINN